MKIMIFGGAFDPPHRGHFQVVKDVLQQNLADEVWLVPTGKHDFDKNMAKDQHRLAMLKLMIKAFQPLGLVDKIKINAHELGSEEVNQTIDTLDALAEQHPQHQFMWLMGSDNLARFEEWDDYQRIIHDYQTYIYPRDGFELQPWYEGLTLLKNAEPVAISSTQVRQKLRQNKDVSQLVLSTINNYIIQHNLYQA
jgi:nicotinate-nucleotide adenylyltransferase